MYAIQPQKALPTKLARLFEKRKLRFKRVKSREIIMMFRRQLMSPKRVFLQEAFRRLLLL